MYKLLAITSRQLCKEKFLHRLEKIAATKISAIILREKDLPPAAYEQLARQVLPLCQRCNTLCILHTYEDISQRLRWPHIHMPLSRLRQSSVYKGYWKTLGVSVHSVEEAEEAAGLGATYLTAGHIFATACKKNLLPRGTGLLREICQHTVIPVYALGGITPQTITKLRGLPIEGAAIMSALMDCNDPSRYVDTLLASK
ncbi:MAG: thiamine phosphate synthase [Veillonellales bacterium]